jgi:hypothetical protein
MPERIAEPKAREAEGLCATCARARRITNDRGSVFVLCLHSTNDPSFPKYPRLPVIACRAFAEAGDASRRG